MVCIIYSPPPDMNRVNEPYKNLWEQVPMSLYVPAALLVYSLCSSFSGGKLCSSEDLVGTWIKLWHAKISVRTDILCNKIGIPSIFCRVSKGIQSCNAIFDYSVEEIHTQLFSHKKQSRQHAFFHIIRFDIFPKTCIFTYKR